MRKERMPFASGQPLTPEERPRRDIGNAFADADAIIAADTAAAERATRAQYLETIRRTEGWPAMWEAMTDEERAASE